MKYFLLLGLGLSLFACESAESNKVTDVEKVTNYTSETSQNKWTCKAIPLDGKGWGYQLFKGSHLEINQKNVPAVNGLHYFETEEQALIAAKFALSKIAEGIFPPTVNPEELDSIGAINLDSLNSLINTQK